MTSAYEYIMYFDNTHYVTFLELGDLRSSCLSLLSTGIHVWTTTLKCLKNLQTVLFCYVFSQSMSIFGSLFLHILLFIYSLILTKKKKVREEVEIPFYFSSWNSVRSGSLGWGDESSTVLFCTVHTAVCSDSCSGWCGRRSSIQFITAAWDGALGDPKIRW